jgi:hypothetical protein
MDEPCRRAGVSRSASNVVIFPWIRRREPIPDITLQLVTYQPTLALRDLAT